MNLYLRANDNPTRYVDPTGHDVQATTVEDVRSAIAAQEPNAAGRDIFEAPANAGLTVQQKQARHAEVENVDQVLKRLEAMGYTHLASYTVDEDDVKGGKLNVNRVVAKLTKTLGGFAFEDTGLAQKFADRLKDVQVGGSVDVSDLYSLGYLISSKRTIEAGEIEGSKGGFVRRMTVGPIQRNAIYGGLAREGLAPEGYGLEAAAGLGLEAYGDVGLVGLAGNLGRRGLGFVARGGISSALDALSEKLAILQGGELTTLGREVSNPAAPLLRARTGARAAELIETLSNSQRGPVLSGVMDTKTGETFFGINSSAIPQNLHPLLRARLEAMLEETGGMGRHFSVPGTHSEISALNDALWAREAATGASVTESELGDFLLHNRSLRGVRAGVGVPPPCGNCSPVVNGVTLVP